jgi:hypothetical protein
VNDFSVSHEKNVCGALKEVFTSKRALKSLVNFCGTQELGELGRRSCVPKVSNITPLDLVLVKARIGGALQVELTNPKDKYR